MFLEIFGIEFSKDSSLLATCTSLGDLNIYDVHTSNLIQTHSHEQYNKSTSLNFNKNYDNLICMSSEDGSIALYELNKSDFIPTYY